jgi:hypothetical protein
VVAAGVFAPGHLGELTRVVPFEMVDAVLAETGRVQRRVRKLPARVVVYVLLAAALFEGLGYGGVWRKLTAGLGGLAVPAVSETALWWARRRLGVAPLRVLFELLRGPVATARTAGSRWRGLVLCAVDGTTLTVPDGPANLARGGKHSSGHGVAGYPQVRLLALVACGTRAIIDAVFGPTSTGELGYARRLLGALRPGMLLLADRNFGAADLLDAITERGAHYLVRLKANRRLPVLARYPDGSYLSVLGTTKVRIIQASITITTSSTSGTHTGSYRLATTLTNHHHYPAFDLIQLYHQRWEIETAYLELKHTMLGGRVLRSRTPTDIDQEIYALLSTYQALRSAITDATDSTGADPDRASFTIALQAARDQLTQAANIVTDTTIDLIGTIGRHILTNLMPTRRQRISPRAVKRPLSRYAHQSLRINRTSYKATININIHAPP